MFFAAENFVHGDGGTRYAFSIGDEVNEDLFSQAELDALVAAGVISTVAVTAPVESEAAMQSEATSEAAEDDFDADGHV